MGMYTTLRFTAPLSEHGMVVVSALQMAQKHKAEAWRKGESALKVWDAVCRLLDGLETYARLPRADFIPFGGVCGIAEDPEWESRNDIIDGMWIVCCSLKNYNNEIGIFLHNVLPLLIEQSCLAETWYEEDTVQCRFRVHPVGADKLVEQLPSPLPPFPKHP